MSTKKTLALSLVALLLLAIVTIPALGVRDFSEGAITPDTASDTTTVSHNLTFRSSDINASGETVLFYLRFPDAVSLSVNTATAEDGNGSAINLSSPAKVVDGEDWGSVNDSIKIHLNPDRGGASVDITIHLNVDITYPNLADDTTYEVVGSVYDINDGTATGPTSIAVVNVSATGGPTTLSGFDNAPTDPDEDGAYEDVNGDGSASISDVQALFANRNSEAVQNNEAAFDFNQDGMFSLADVQALFIEVL